MWGRGKKSASGGYTDQIYRSRRTNGGFESKSRCCCFYLTRSVLLIFLLIFLIGAGGLSVLSCIFGYSQRWTYNVNRNVNPAYSIRTGWLDFSDNRMTPGSRTSLETLSKASYILGIVCLVMSCLSALFALFFSIRALCGRVGRGFICFSIPFSILLMCSLAAYYIVTAFQVWKWADKIVGQSRVPWPDWAWGLGAGGALLWFLSAAIASVLPNRHKYMDAEADFEPSRVSPIRDYQNAPLRNQAAYNQDPHAARDSAYLPSSPEPPMPNGLNPPLAALENPTTDTGEGKKRSFVPSWSRKPDSVKPSELNSTGNGAAFDAPAGSYRSRAEEIANRYRGRNAEAGNVEMAPSAPPPPKKGAW